MNWLVLSFQRGIFVAGLREEIVNNAAQVLKLLESGEGLKTKFTGLGIYLFIFFFKAQTYICLKTVCFS